MEVDTSTEKPPDTALSKRRVSVALPAFSDTLTSAIVTAALSSLLIVKVVFCVPSSTAPLPPETPATSMKTVSEFSTVVSFAIVKINVPDLLPAGIVIVLLAIE